MISPSRTSTAPTGTSPADAAARAHSSAVRMKAASRPSSVAAVMRLARRGHGRQEQGRIDEDRIQRDAEVQVRTRDAARGPDLAEQRSGLQVLPGTHVDLAEVT